MKGFLLFSLFVVFSLFQFSETRAQAVLSQSELDSLLDKAEQATLEYSETFKNLSAEETKIFQDYKKDGKPGEKRIIKSNFIVYQSPKNNKANEFRYVIEYNGKNVAENNQNVVRFFDNLQKAASNEEEAVKLKTESVRFDGRVTTWGFTLRQQSPLGKFRPFFDFKIVSKVKVEGRDVYIVEYHQNKHCPLILANPIAEEYSNDPERRQYNTHISQIFRPTNPLLEGYLWLDAETGQIWRNEFKVILHPPQLSKPIVSLEFLHEYQPSSFKILVPKKFRVLTYKILGANDKNLVVTKEKEMFFEFSKFREFLTETKDFKTVDELPK